MKSITKKPISIKKIIAREGLIIISFLLLASVSLILDEWQINNLKFQVITPVIGNGNPFDRFDEQAVNLKFPQKTKKEIIEKVIKRDFPNINFDNWIIWDDTPDKNMDDINAVYDKKGNQITDNKLDGIFYKVNFEDISIILLIFVYPLYLLSRFIVWAIITLKR
jgi:hypothetical protein